MFSRKDIKLEIIEEFLNACFDDFLMPQDKKVFFLNFKLDEEVFKKSLEFNNILLFIVEIFLTKIYPKEIQIQEKLFQILQDGDSIHIDDFLNFYQRIYRQTEENREMLKSILFFFYPFLEKIDLRNFLKICFENYLFYEKVIESGIIRIS